MLSVYISYGFAEGPKVSKQLVAALHSAGFRVTDEHSKADVIIAHSMGCFTLPPNTNAKTVLLAGPSTGFYGTSPALVQVQKVRKDLTRSRKAKRVGAWARKSIWNFLYLIRILGQLQHIRQHARKLQHTLPAIKADKVLVVTYRDDPWSWHYPPAAFARHPHYAYLSHTGVHDDLWTNPKEYVAVLQYLHEA